VTAPFAVRLKTARRDIHVTRQVQDLTWRSVAPGGYASASIQLERPLSFTPDELAYYGHLYIYDARNARTLWEGRVEDLGRGSDSSGQVWTVNAVGPMAHAKDQTVPLIYQDVSIDTWQPGTDAPPWLNRQTIATTSYGPGIQMNVPRGTGVFTGAYSAFVYGAFAAAGQHVAQVAFHYGEDTTDAGFQWQLLIDGVVVSQHNFTAGSSSFVTLNVGTSWTTAQVYPSLVLNRSGVAITINNDTNTASFTNLMTRSTLFDPSGAERLDTFWYSTPLNTTRVVQDLLGRLLPLYDGIGASLDSSQDFTFTGQLAYPDGATADQVFADMMAVTPSMYWTAGATNASGKWSFAWRQWPTTVRYEATAEGGFSSPSSAEGIYDTVNVRWVDAGGNPQNTTRTLSNAVLNAAGFHRSTRLDLGSSVGGLAQAQQVGDLFLAQNAVPASAGTLTVTKRVLDRLKGWMVDPWEIEPGYLIRVRNVAPTVSPNSNRDGVTTFRVVATTVNQAEASATLELDAPAINVSNIIASMQARQSYTLRS
jgi:hypothetical protein